MKKALVGLLFLASLGFLAPAPADESIPPTQVGSGQTTTQYTNGQMLQISANGVSATIYYNEISANRVTGLAVRSSGGTSSGTVSILWINRGEEVELFLTPSEPEQPFGMEGGEGDKKNPQQITPW